MFIVKECMWACMRTFFLCIKSLSGNLINVGRPFLWPPKIKPGDLVSDAASMRERITVKGDVKVSVTGSRY